MYLFVRKILHFVSQQIFQILFKIYDHQIWVVKIFYKDTLHKSWILLFLFCTVFYIFHCELSKYNLRYCKILPWMTRQKNSWNRWTGFVYFIVGYPLGYSGFWKLGNTWSFFWRIDVNGERALYNIHHRVLNSRCAE